MVEVKMHFGAIQDVLYPVFKNKLSVCRRWQGDALGYLNFVYFYIGISWERSSALLFFLLGHRVFAARPFCGRPQNGFEGRFPAVCKTVWLFKSRIVVEHGSKA